MNQREVRVVIEKYLEEKGGMMKEQLIVKIMKVPELCELTWKINNE